MPFFCCDDELLSKAVELPTGASNGRTHQCGSGFVEMCTVVQSEQKCYVK